LTYKKKLYGIPVDVNNVAMVYNTKLVTTAPKTFGDMVDYYKANKTSKNLKAGLCVAGGGMSWGAHSVASALGADAYYFNPDGRINKSKTFNPNVFGANVKKFLLDGKKSNGFFPASDTGCKDNFLAGSVPFAIIGNWDWTDYTAKGFTMNLMPVPGATAGQNGNAFGSVSGALLTTFAATRGREAAAKSVLTDFFGSTAGQVAYQKYEKRPPAEKGAASSASVTDGQKGFGASASAASIPQVGAILNGAGKSYWDSLPAYWTSVLVDGKDPVAEAKKLAGIYLANLRAAANDI
jgi:arabinogalactan oligomer/maltooligosaccharide transport system substrate-binding protein